ncbi:Homeobox-containing protein 1 [Tupaia chinensis]|uniref:Homeobox-containing protein 1 n=1 Tax=Tupaia chinensis TaxID=246437 RepID=L9KN25_TUPCH|nr:Homeobox-containing protein 1 [Tupaia chinensis]
MTKHEILHALETLDRLDQEHSDKFGRRSSYGGSSYGNSTNNVPASSSTATASTQTQHSGMSPSPSNSYDTSPQPCTTNQNGRENNERLSTSNGKLSPTRYHANSMGQRSYSFEASEEDLDVDDKVEELMRRDSSVIKEEIKAFLANRRISQAVVAQVTGISQSRISHWLLQQGSDLSEQKKRAFYRWYQLEKTNPGKKLSDLERVTSLKVYNWFANRRKEIKRRANIAILESHGIDVQSPGGHSNSDDVDGNDYSEQDDSTSHSDHQDPISLAVEMAAVNHTILALARQGASEIKTEALDDD